MCENPLHVQELAAGWQALLFLGSAGLLIIRTCWTYLKNRLKI